jgi:methyltransferase family protein
MKDIIANRRRLSLSTKLRVLRLSVQENGVLWSLLVGIYYVSSALAEKCFALASARRAKFHLPGLNSSTMNKLIWERWDWSSGGEEWTPSPEWKLSVINTLLRPHVLEGSTVLEVGPGLGRWTEALLNCSENYVGVDISAACVQGCRKRFERWPNARFLVGSGSDLSDVATSSIDMIWSFDVFMHINKPQFQSYAREFSRVLSPRGIGVIQHGGVAGIAGGWESDMTEEDVRDFLQQADLVVEDQIRAWRDGDDEFRAGAYGNFVTIFRVQS